MPDVPVTRPEWREFLTGYSADHLRVATGDQRANFRPGQLESGWLGREPAGEGAVRTAEERLGVSLPPSYRNFPLASDGWSGVHSVIWELREVDRIGWLSELDPQFLAAWSSHGNTEVVELVERSLPAGPTGPSRGCRGAARRGPPPGPGR